MVCIRTGPARICWAQLGLWGVLLTACAGSKTATRPPDPARLAVANAVGDRAAVVLLVDVDAWAPVWAKLEPFGAALPKPWRKKLAAAQSLSVFLQSVLGLETLTLAALDKTRPVGIGLGEVDDLPYGVAMVEAMRGQRGLAPTRIILPSKAPIQTAESLTQALATGDYKAQSKTPNAIWVGSAGQAVVVPRTDHVMLMVQRFDGSLHDAPTPAPWSPQLTVMAPRMTPAFAAFTQPAQGLSAWVRARRLWRPHHLDLGSSWHQVTAERWSVSMWVRVALQWRNGFFKCAVPAADSAASFEEHLLTVSVEADTLRFDAISEMSQKTRVAVEAARRASTTDSALALDMQRVLRDVESWPISMLKETCGAWGDSHAALRRPLSLWVALFGRAASQSVDTAFSHDLAASAEVLSRIAPELQKALSPWARLRGIAWAADGILSTRIVLEPEGQARALQPVRASPATRTKPTPVSRCLHTAMTRLADANAFETETVDPAEWRALHTRISDALEIDLKCAVNDPRTANAATWLRRTVLTSGVTALERYWHFKDALAFARERCAALKDEFICQEAKRLTSLGSDIVPRVQQACAWKACEYISSSKDGLRAFVGPDGVEMGGEFVPWSGLAAALQRHANDKHVTATIIPDPRARFADVTRFIRVFSPRNIRGHAFAVRFPDGEVAQISSSLVSWKAMTTGIGASIPKSIIWMLRDGMRMGRTKQPYAPADRLRFSSASSVMVAVHPEINARRVIEEMASLCGRNLIIHLTEAP